MANRMVLWLADAFSIGETRLAFRVYVFLSSSFLRTFQLDLLFQAQSGLNLSW
jgi:hypothetical protein